MSVADAQKVKLPLKNLGVRFVESYYHIGDYSGHHHLGRRTLEMNVRAVELLKEIAKKAKAADRKLWIYHDRGVFDGSTFRHTEIKILGIGFHIEKERSGDLDWKDFFVQPDGQTSIFYGSGLYGNPPSETKHITAKQFADHFAFYLEFGSDEVEMRAKNSAEAIGHLRRKEA